jgi:hypothetical protein
VRRVVPSRPVAPEEGSSSGLVLRFLAIETAETARRCSLVEVDHRLLGICDQVDQQLPTYPRQQQCNGKGKFEHLMGFYWTLLD